MKILQFEQIIAINDVGSINLAAERLFMSQSQLSSSVRALEQELGADIFIRSNKGVTLTPFGEEFLPYISSILLQIQQIKQLGQNVPHNARLSIANSGFRFISEIIASMYTRYANSGVSIEAYDYPGLKAVDMVAGQIADIGILRIWSHQKSFIRKQLKSKEIDFFLLDTMPLTVIVGPNNPLYHSETGVVSLEQLTPYTPIQLSYMKYNPISSIYKQFPQLDSRNQLFISSRNMIYEIIARTDAYYITATPMRAYQKTPYYPNTRILSLAVTEYSAQLGWIKSKSTILSDIGHDFIQLLNEYF